jgi:arylsulfatase
MRWYKQMTHGGGVRDPLVVHWPRGIRDRGEIRNQFHHVTDIAPTLLELAGVSAPEEYAGIPQLPMAGTSLAYTFDEATTPTRRSAQYFEMFGHRAIWSNGWKAVSRHEPGTDFDDDTWELFHLDNDISETKDLATLEPKRLEVLVDLWWTEAERHGVLPLDDRTLELFRDTPLSGSPHASRTYRYRTPISHLPSGAGAGLGNRSFGIETRVSRHRGSEGVLVATGGANVGFSLFVQTDRLVFDYNIFHDHRILRSEEELPVGECRLGVHFRRDGSTGTVTLLVDGIRAGSMEVPFVIRMLGSAGMDIGRDAYSPVSTEYEGPYPFEGQLQEVVIHLPDREASLEDALIAMRTEMGTE